MSKDIDRKLFWVSVLVVLCFVMTILGVVRGCGGKKTTVINEAQPLPAACGDSPSGEVRELECPEGQGGPR